MLIIKLRSAAGKCRTELKTFPGGGGVEAETEILQSQASAGAAGCMAELGKKVFSNLSL